MLFQRFQCLLNERTKGKAATNLRLDDGAPDEEVHDGQYLAIVRHQGLSDVVLPIVAANQGLQHLESFDNHLLVAGVERRLDGDDELRQHRQDAPSLADVHHVVDAPLGKKSVRFLHLAQAVEEDWQVVMILQPLDANLPRDAVVHAAVVDLDGQVAALVEAAELRVGRVGPLDKGRELNLPRGGGGIDGVGRNVD